MPKKRITKRATRGIKKPVVTLAKKTRRKKTRVTRLKKGPIVRAAEMVGGLVAPGIGSTVGRMAGYGAQAIYNYITGSGDYSIQKNSLMGVTNVPSFGETRIRLRAREYVTDVFGSTSFFSRVLDINPGNPGLFPWLSTVATQFQQYEFHGLVLEFVSTSSNALASTNTALGKVIMATNYNASSADFPDAKSALITSFANMGKPADNLVHAVECKRSSSVLENLYINNGLVPITEDPKFYNLGKFQLSTEGMQQNDTNIGGLWVSYDVELSKPVLGINAEQIPSQMWQVPSVATGLTSAMKGPEPPSPSLGLDFYQITSTLSYIEIKEPYVGDQYIVQFNASGPSAAVPTLNELRDGVGLNPLAIRSTAGFGTTATFARMTEFLVVNSTTPTFLPFVGLSLSLTGDMPALWTGYWTISALNPNLPKTVFPSALLSKREKLLRLQQLEEREEHKEEVVDPPKLPVSAPAVRGSRR